jgi:hypothetical protein
VTTETGITIDYQNQRWFVNGFLGPPDQTAYKLTWEQGLEG